MRCEEELALGKFADARFCPAKLWPLTKLRHWNTHTGLLDCDGALSVYALSAEKNPDTGNLSDS